MAYRVIIMPPAKRRLDMYVGYTIVKLNNRQAAKAILDDAKATKKGYLLLLILLRNVKSLYWRNMDTQK